jgi:transposase-like protein
MSIRKRQVFSAEFKREAVALLGKSDKDVAQLARELRVKRSHLYRTGSKDEGVHKARLWRCLELLNNILKFSQNYSNRK